MQLKCTIFYKKEGFKMIQFIIGLIVGANVSRCLYACIIAGAKSDKEVIYIEDTQNYSKKQ